MRVPVFVSALLLFSLQANCQTTEDSVKAVITKMFEAMKAADTAALKECFADSAILQTVMINKQGNSSIRTDALNRFVSSIGNIQKGEADEQITFSSINLDGNLASVWTPYKFYFKGKFSHCGANSFQLVRINGSWKIQYLIDTRRKAGC